MPANKGLVLDSDVDAKIDVYGATVVVVLARDVDDISDLWHAFTEKLPTEYDLFEPTYHAGAGNDLSFRFAPGIVIADALLELLSDIVAEWMFGNPRRSFELPEVLHIKRPDGVVAYTDE